MNKIVIAMFLSFPLLASAQTATINGGIAVPVLLSPATSTTPGVTQPDGTTILVDGTGKTSVSPLAVTNAIGYNFSSIEASGTQTNWATLQCGSNPFCFAQYHTSSLVNRALAPRPAAGGTSLFGYISSPSPYSQVGAIGSFNGDIALISANANDGLGMTFNSTNTHRSQQNMAPFQFVYAQTFGNDANYAYSNRDNTGVFTIASTMAGGQNGATFTLSSMNYGRGDNVLMNFACVGSGIAQGDEEGDCEKERGYFGTNLGRWAPTLTGTTPATFDPITQAYDFTSTGGVSGLGIYNYLLNTSNSYQASVSSIDVCSAGGTNFMCITGSGDGTGNFTAVYGTSTMQALTVPSGGQITIVSQPVPAADYLKINGQLLSFVASNPNSTQVLLGASISGTITNLFNYLNTTAIAALSSNTFTYSLIQNTISITSASPVTLAFSGVERFVLANANSVRSIDAGETLPVPMATTVNVASTANCGSVGSSVVIVDNLDYQIATVLAIPSPTSITLATYDFYKSGDVLSCGGAAGYGFEMNADDIPANQALTLLGQGINNGGTFLRPRMHPVVGSNAAGQLVVWATMSNDYYTRGLMTNTVPTPPTVALTISAAGALTAGVITQTGNAYSNRSATGATTIQSMFLPTPTVTFSAGCTAIATVSYYSSGNLLYIGIPNSTVGGSGILNITNNGGTSCLGATATFTSAYSNPGTIYPMAIVDAFTYAATGAGPYALTGSPIVASLIHPSEWATGNAVTSELGAHTKTKETEGEFFYNTSDGGGNQLEGAWGQFNYTGVAPGTYLKTFWNQDNPILFAQPNLPTSTTQGLKRSPNGIQIKGSFGTSLLISTPVGSTINQNNPNATVIQLDCLGYVSCANQVPVSLFAVIGADSSNNSFVWNPITKTFIFNAPSVLIPNALTAGVISATTISATTTFALPALTAGTSPLCNPSGSVTNVGCYGNAIPNVQIVLPTTAIPANSCTGTATVSMTGTVTSSTFTTAFASSPVAVVGWGASNGLAFEAWPTLNTLNWSVCNGTSASITPGALNMNVGVK